MAQRDYEEFIESLNENRVRYLVVGAHAVAFHARPRATKDLDIYFERTEENARRVLTAIRAFFGGADLGFTVEDLTNPDIIIQLGVAPLRIDLLSSLLGVPDFGQAWEKRMVGKYGQVGAHYLSLDDLIRAKQTTGRDQDKADLRALRRVKARQ